MKKEKFLTIKEHLEKKLQYRFSRPELLQEALTHASYFFEQKNHNIHHNERLEFLGDSVLSLSVSRYLFEHLKDVEEGVLTKQRALVVCEKTLVQVAQSLSLGECLSLGKGEYKNGGQHNISNLANAVEALLGAIFLDAGFETVEKIVLFLLKDFLLLAKEGRLIYDYKSKLFECIQREHHSSALNFRLMETTGPDHAPQFKISLFLYERCLATAVSTSKKEAEQEASRLALEILEKEEKNTCN